MAAKITNPSARPPGKWRGGGPGPRPRRRNATFPKAKAMCRRGREVLFLPFF